MYNVVVKPHKWITTFKQEQIWSHPIRDKNEHHIFREEMNEKTFIEIKVIMLNTDVLNEKQIA